MLAKMAEITSSHSLNFIGLGGFLHDIGCSQLTFDPEELEVLTAEQRKEMWRHPEMGKRMLDGVKGVRSEVLDIILQHHEQPNGQGYPNGIRNTEIYPMAKIVSIADSFSALISKRSFRAALSPDEALAIMNSDIGKFDKKYLKIFSDLILPKR